MFVEGIEMTKGLYLYRRTNGFYYIGQRLPDGKVKWTTTKCKDKPSALQYLRSFQPSSNRDRKDYKLSQFTTLVKDRLKGAVRDSTLTQYVYALTCLKDVVGDKYISSLTVGDMEEFKSVRVANTKPNSVNILLRGIKTTLNRAIEWELIDANPMMKVKLYKIPKLSPKFFTKEEFAHLLATVRGHASRKVDKEQLIDLFTFAVNTGLRLSEITHLRWFGVDFPARQFTIANTWNFETKSGKQRTLPMTETVYQILQRQLARRYKDTTYVFQKPGGYPYTKDYLTHKFTEFRKDAKLPRVFTFHSMRHTFISWSLMSGIDIFTVKEFAGHSDTHLIDLVYGHLTDRHKVAEINKLELYQKDQKG